MDPSSGPSGRKAATPATIGSMPLPRIEPMLAHTKTMRDGGEWSIEPKLDGWRAMV